MSTIINEEILSSQFRMSKEVVLHTIKNLQRFVDKGNKSAEAKIKELREKYKDLLAEE